VNWQHLQTFLWLRWRLARNAWRRAGALNAVLMLIISIGALLTAIPLFVGCYMLGLFLIPKATPAQLMYVGDGIIAAFLFFWGIGLITELQRSEPLTLSKFLHLPVSVNGAFLINYVSSLLRLSLIVFVPVLLGFSLALVWTKGILLLPVLPALAAFLLMVTALTYQFQGWLASLMSNPRRRRTIIVASTMIFVLLAQLPNLVNFLSPWGAQRQADRSRALVDEFAKLDRADKAGEIDVAEHLRRQNELMEKQKRTAQEEDSASVQQWAEMVRLGNLVLPVGWLPFGVMAGAEGRVLPAILGLFGMGGIGAFSLWRAYRTTLGLYSGQASNVEAPPVQIVTPARRAAVALPVSGPRATGFLEARIPGLSEPVSAIALGGFRALVRSPEAKMMLLSPIIMIPIFGSMLWRGRAGIPEALRPLVAIGGMVLVLFGVVQLMGNQFGFDRDGFRVFILSPASRRDILLGKNLVFAPLVLVFAAIVLVLVQIFCPLSLDHFLGMFPHFVSMFLMFCIFTNLMSIITPMHVAAGSLKPANPKATTVLLQLVMFFFIFPLTQAPTLVPLGIEALLRFMGWTVPGLPIYLLLCLVECAVIGGIYYVSLIWLGELFQAREQKILQSVAKAAA
jgi:ABC-2 type transport system permease protein